MGQPRTAFVLAGGGSLGAVEAGMLLALVERGIAPDLVVGASVGAINGTFFAGRPDRAGSESLAGSRTLSRRNSSRPRLGGTTGRSLHARSTDSSARYLGI